MWFVRGIQGALIPSVPTNVRCSRRFFDDLWELSGSAFVVSVRSGSSDGRY